MANHSAGLNVSLFVFFFFLTLTTLFQLHCNSMYAFIFLLHLKRMPFPNIQLPDVAFTDDSTEQVF